MREGQPSHLFLIFIAVSSTLYREKEKERGNCQKFSFGHISLDQGQVYNE